MSDFTGMVIIAFLLLISVELLLIHRDLLRNQSMKKPHGDEASGQTINVNVGTPAGLQPVPVATAIVGTAEQENLENGQEEDSANPAALDGESDLDQQKATALPQKPERQTFDASARPTPSGLVAKKCPSCGAENSSYRNQCFNCNASL